MKDILLITTKGIAIRDIILLLNKDYAQSRSWVLDGKEVKPLSAVDSLSGSAVVLIDESKPLNAHERSRLKDLLEGNIVHWTWHQEENPWRNWLKKINVPFLEHREQSQRGAAADLLRQWCKRKKLSYRKSLLATYFKNSRLQSIEFLKRKWLNERQNMTLVRIGQRLQVGDTRDFTEQLLLENYPEVAAKLLAFEQDRPLERVVYHQIELANYLYPSSY